jgi:hypothetical protein
MSRVISFRLDDADDAPAIERKALEVLDYWQRQGVEPRQLIAQALAQFDRGEPPVSTPVSVDTGEIIAAIRAELPTMVSNGNGSDLADSQALAHELRQTLRQAQGLIEALRRTPAAAPVATNEQSELKPEFVSGLRKSARRGFNAGG